MAGREKDKQRVLADPHAELPVQNFKYVKNCVELYLSQRGIDELAHFENFVNLEVLWLNHNRIDKLEGLDQCFRIKELYAQGNRIRSLHGSSLVHFKFLQTMRLNDNKLTDFASTLAVLARLHHLEDLDLYGNPVEEEDNYRLHVVRAVPSLLVLDRHVVTQEERAKAARLRDDPVFRSDPTVTPTKKSKPRPEVVAGAPPQTMSGTVKMLFREVEKIEREREAARKEALAQELRRMDQQQQQLTHPTSASRSRASALASYKGGGSGLDAWEVAALEKQFRSVEDKPKAGIPLERVADLVAYLADRGFGVSCGGISLTQDGVNQQHKRVFSAAETKELTTVFPTVTGISWQQFVLALDTRQLQCEFLAPKQLRQRADAYFTQAAAAQKRLNSASGDDARARLMRDSHEAAQRAYHLAALADGTSGHDDHKLLDKMTLSPLRTRYYVTTFARNDAETPKFHELKDQSARVGAELSAKYKLQQKDFQKYMVKQAPPATTVVRRHFNL